jgi:hypothetical protein
MGSMDFLPKLAHLTRHVLKETLPVLLSGKAIGKPGIKSSEFFNKLADVVFYDQQFGYGITPVLHAAFRNYGLTLSPCFFKTCSMVRH